MSWILPSTVSVVFNADDFITCLRASNRVSVCSTGFRCSRSREGDFLLESASVTLLGGLCLCFKWFATSVGLYIIFNVFVYFNNNK